MVNRNAALRIVLIAFLFMLSLGLLTLADSSAQASPDALPSLHADCNTSLPITKTLRGKSTILDQCYNRAFTHNGANYRIHAYYTENGANATNLAQCTAAENMANRCEHALANNDDGNGDNINAVAMAAEAEAAFRFYIDRNLDFAGTQPLPAGTEVNVFIGEDPRLGGIPDSNSILVDDDAIDNNDALQKRLLAYHEMNHLVQIQYDSSWHDYYGEGFARAIEDRVNAALDADTGHLFIPEVNGILSNDGARSSDLLTNTYRTVLWWTWLADQYRIGPGTDPPVPPDIGWDATRDFYVELETQQADELGATKDFISGQGDNFRDAFIDYTLALYAYRFNPTNPRLGFIDAEINATGGLSNHTVLTTGPAFSTVTQNMAVRSSRYTEFTPANQCDYVAFSFDGNGKQYGFSVMTVDGGNLQNRWTSYSAEWARTVRSIDLDRVVGVITAVDQNGDVDLGRGCVDPTIEIKSPTTAAFQMIGLANNPRKFIVRLHVEGADGSAVAGLVADDFNVSLNLSPVNGGPDTDVDAEIINSTYVLDDYWLLVQAPSNADDPSIGNGLFYDLTVELGTSDSDTESAAVVYLERTQDVNIVLDRSGSMGGTTGKIEAAKNAADLLVNQLSEDDQGGYLAYDTDAGTGGVPEEALSDMTPAHRTALENAIAAEVAGGATSIGDGMRMALNDQIANGEALNLCSFVLLSDGHENEPEFWATVRPDIIAQGCPVHSIALGPGANEVLMQQISASVPGGTYDYATTTGNVPINSTLNWENNLSRIYSNKAQAIAGQQRLLTAVGNFTFGAAATNGLIDFEDQPAGRAYKVGEVFTASDVPVTVKEFGGSDQGNAFVSNNQNAGGTGQDMGLGNVNLDFDFDGPLAFMSMLFGDFGGTINVEINDDFRVLQSMTDINGANIGGVEVSVVMLSDFQGQAAFEGQINQFAIGGQELWIDNVNFRGAERSKLEIPVDDASDVLVVSIGWQKSTGGSHETILEDPDGNLVPTSMRRTSSKNTNDVWEVPKPKEGIYLLDATGLSNQEFFVTASALSRYELFLFIGAPELADGNQGAEVPILATFVGPKGPILGADVNVVVTDPAGAERNMQLFDDGNHGDGESNDGVYGNKYTATSFADQIAQLPQDGEEPQVSGSYRVVATAVRGNIKREAEGSFAIQEARDSDEDMMPDGWEIKHGLDPKVDDSRRDPDMDGLTNKCEFQLGTDPHNSDTDGGGESDGSEVPQGREGKCVATGQDPLDPSDDRIAPISSFVAIPEATVQGSPFNRLVIGVPNTVNLQTADIMRQTRDEKGDIKEEWHSVDLAQVDRFVFVDPSLEAGLRYEYKLMPGILSDNRILVDGRSIVTPDVEASKDPYPPGGSILINGGAPTTDSLIVDLSLSADDSLRDVDVDLDVPPIPFTPVDQLMMRISNKLEGIGTSPWMPYASEVKDWNLDSVASGQTAVVYAQFKDNNENVSEPLSVDSIIFEPSGPTLIIPDEVETFTGQTVVVPVILNTNGSNIASLAFSVNFDEAKLGFDPTDADLDGVPDSINFLTPAAFIAGVTVNLGDTDGELDFAVFDQAPPIASLPDGVIAEIEFSANANPGPGGELIAPVVFSDDPVASFGDPNGADVPGSTEDGSVLIKGFRFGDCNGDGVVNAADITAEVLEIFDGDGTAPGNAHLGSFIGTPACDSNEDNTIGAADITCTVLIIFNGPGACGGSPFARGFGTSDTLIGGAQSGIKGVAAGQSEYALRFDMRQESFRGA